MVTKDIQYIGVDDKTLDLFEGQYVVPHGVSYNSYVILDEKVAVMDTVDHRKTAEYLAHLEKALCGRKPDYLVISHLEPDHASSIQALSRSTPRCGWSAMPRPSRCCRSTSRSISPTR